MSFRYILYTNQNKIEVGVEGRLMVTAHLSQILQSSFRNYRLIFVSICIIPLSIGDLVVDSAKEKRDDYCL